jgi:hypothetical protein
VGFKAEKRPSSEGLFSLENSHHIESHTNFPIKSI